MPEERGRLHLSRIETCWITPWLVSQMSRLGRRHWQKGQPYQDAARIGNMGDTFWLILGDGISEAELSHYGSQLAVDTVDKVLSNAIRSGALPSKTLLTDAFDAAHKAIATEASRSGRRPSAFSTTLVAALMRGNTIYTAAIGDSSAVLYSSHEGPDGQELRHLVPFCSTPRPEKRGATWSISDDDYRRYMRVVETHSLAVRALVLATDGASAFYLKDTGVEEHAFDATYLDAIEPWLRHPKLNPRLFCNFFGALLNKADADDDETLLVAYRLPEDLVPPLPQPKTARP